MLYLYQGSIYKIKEEDYNTWTDFKYSGKDLGPYKYHEHGNSYILVNI